MRMECAAMARFYLVRAFINDVRKDLEENPEETALIQRNIEKLREQFAPRPKTRLSKPLLH